MIFVFSSYVVPQMIILSTTFEFSTTDWMMINEVRNYRLYSPKIHDLICLDDDKNIKETLDFIVFREPRKSSWNCDSWTDFLFSTHLWLESMNLSPINPVITEQYAYCQLVETFQSTYMNPTDRYLKLEEIVNTKKSGDNDNDKQRDVLNLMDIYFESDSATFYFESDPVAFSNKINIWCSNGKYNDDLESQLINKHNLRMYREYNERYHDIVIWNTIAAVIVSLCFSHFTNIWIRIIHKKVPIKIILLHHVGVSDLCDLIVQYL
eukprot:487894_1